MTTLFAGCHSHACQDYDADATMAAGCREYGQACATPLDLVISATIFIPGLGEVAIAEDGVEAVVGAADAESAAADADAAAADATADGAGGADDETVTCGITGGESFTPDTNVVMADGSSKPLDQVKVGDKVEATATTTGKFTVQTVTSVWVNHDTDLMDVTITAGGTTSTIHATQHHLFWDATRGSWVEADQLASGDALRTDDGTLATVTSTVVIPGAADMWDLTVTNDHDFYVVTNAADILVHNCPVYRGTTNPDDPDYPDSFEPMKQRGSGQPNYVENTQANDAANQVGLTSEQASVFHNAITGRGITSYSELVQIAQDVADGKIY